MDGNLHNDGFWRDLHASYLAASGSNVGSGYRIRAGSASHVHRRYVDHRYRYRDPSPPDGRGRLGGRATGRTFNEPDFGPGPSSAEGISRNNPNVRPRAGDWICPDPVCKNLNFARRESCNNCNRIRQPAAERTMHPYICPPPRVLARPGDWICPDPACNNLNFAWRDYCNNCNRIRPPPVERTMNDFICPPRNNCNRIHQPAAERTMHPYICPPPRVLARPGDWICPNPACNNLNFAWRDYCNNCNRIRPPPVERTMNADRYPPPRGLPRDGPREYGSVDLPPPRHEGWFPDDHVRRERVDYVHDGYRGRNPMDWSHGDRGRNLFSNERVGFGRRLPFPTAPLSPPLPPHRGVRERSRSPLRGGPPP